MGDLPSKVLSHFKPFHEWLEEIAELSNHAHPVGGMIWRVDFTKRKSDLDKRVLSTPKCRQQFISPENTRDISLMWSRFYWKAAGLGGSLQSLAPSEDWSAAETNLTLHYLSVVKFVAPMFASAEASGYSISCEEDAVWMKINSVTLFGKRVLEHEIFWSID